MMTRARRGRLALIVRTAGEERQFVTPADTYADEKAFDREVLRKVLDACRSQGVAECHDRTGS